MKKIIIFVLLVIIILLMRICILDNKVNNLEYENSKLRIMVDNVVDYANSTSDTGEFDEFITSPQGEKFFNEYDMMYNN